MRYALIVHPEQGNLALGDALLVVQINKATDQGEDVQYCTLEVLKEPAIEESDIISGSIFPPVCRWEIDREMRDLFGYPVWKTGCGKLNGIVDLWRWKYCPYCGEQIETK